MFLVSLSLLIIVFFILTLLGTCQEVPCQETHMRKVSNVRVEKWNKWGGRSAWLLLYFLKLFTDCAYWSWSDPRINEVLCDLSFYNTTFFRKKLFINNYKELKTRRGQHTMQNNAWKATKISCQILFSKLSLIISLNKWLLYGSEVLKHLIRNINMWRNHN